MKVIGVTGGIGSGKSTVSSILSGYGAKIIDADLIAREIVEKGEKALEEIVDYFGDSILDNSGNLDRRKLGGIVFDDFEKLGILNNITHKYISDRILDVLNKENDSNIYVIDAAIPFKKGFLDVSNEIWAVVADTDIRITRVMKRSGMSYDEVVKRINLQIKDEDYIKIANRTIYNNGSTQELENIVKSFFDVLLNKKDGE